MKHGMNHTQCPEARKMRNRDLRSKGSAGKQDKKVLDCGNIRTFCRDEVGCTDGAWGH